MVSLRQALPSASIKPVHDQFVTTVTGSTKLVDSAKALVKPPPAKPGHPGLPQFQLNLIYELAFVRCVLAWEAFLHGTMCAYLTGAPGLSGSPAKPKAKVSTLGVTHELLIGEGLPFVSWTSKRTVRDRAELWFIDGEPYKTVLASFSTYDELRTIRNRIVHNNASSQAVFRKLMKKKHSTQQGLGPGADLARTFHGGTRLQAYVAEWTGAALQIATN